MKKSKLFLQTVVLSLLLLLFGCADGSESANGDVAGDTAGDTVSENHIAEATTEGYETTKLTCSYGRNMIFETSTGIYFQNYVDYSSEIGTLSMIEYAESPLGPWIPLCGKPECLHNSENCNAYVGDHMMGMYNNRIYYSYTYFDNDSVTKEGIFSMALDGTDHRSEFSISYDFFFGDTSSVSFSNGYVYYTDRSSSDDAVRFFRVNVDEETATADNIEYVVSEDYYFTGYVDRVPFDGGLLITTVDNNDTRSFKYFVYYFDTNELLTPFEEIGAVPNYFTDKYVYGRGKDVVYVYERETGKITELFRVDTDRTCVMFCDGTYFYGEEVGAIAENEPCRQFYIYDMEGNYIGQTDMDVERGSSGDYQMLYEITDKAVYFTASGIGSFDYAILREDIESGNFDIIKVEH